LLASALTPWKALKDPILLVKRLWEDAHFSWGWKVGCFPEVLRTPALHAVLPEVAVSGLKVLMLSAPSQFLLQQNHCPCIPMLLACVKLGVTIAHFMMTLIGR